MEDVAPPLHSPVRLFSSSRNPSVSFRHLVTAELSGDGPFFLGSRTWKAKSGDVPQHLWEEV